MDISKYKIGHSRKVSIAEYGCRSIDYRPTIHSHSLLGGSSIDIVVGYQLVEEESNMDDHQAITVNERAIENKYRKQAAIHNAVLKAAEWGTSETAKTMSAIARDMLVDGIYLKRELKSRIIPDCSFSEAVMEAATELGLVFDHVADLVDKGSEVELIIQCFIEGIEEEVS